MTFFASFCRWNRELFLRGRRGRRVLDEFVGPRDEVFHVRPVFMSAVVLAPGEFTVEQAGVHGRHFRGAIIFFFANIPRAQETEDRSGGDPRHVAALLVEPIGVAVFGHAVTDERETRRAQRDQLVSINWQIARVPAAEG